MSPADMFVDIEVDEIQVVIEDVPDIDVEIKSSPDVIVVTAQNVGPQGPQGEPGLGVLPGDVIIAANDFIIRNRLLASHAEPVFRMNGDGQLMWGAGGVVAPDQRLYRSGNKRMSFGAFDGTIGEVSFQPGSNWPYILLMTNDPPEGGGAGVGFYAEGPNQGGNWEIYTDSGRDGLMVYRAGGGAVTGKKGDLYKFAQRGFEFSSGGPGGFDAWLYRPNPGMIGVHTDLWADGSVYPQGSMLAASSIIAYNGNSYWQTGLGYTPGLPGPGIYFAYPQDTALYRAAANYLKTDGDFEVGRAIRLGAGMAAGNWALAVKANADAQQRIVITNAGMVYFGDGVNPPDHILQRWSTDAMRFDKTLIVGNALVVGGEAYHASAKWFIDTGGTHQWGPGDWTRDTSLYRDAAGILKTPGALRVGSDLQIGRDQAMPYLYFGNVADCYINKVAANYLRVSGNFDSYGQLIANYNQAGQIWLHPDGGLYFSNLSDTVLKRVGPGWLKTDGHFEVGGDLKGGGRVGEYCKTITDWNQASVSGWFMGSGVANSPPGLTNWTMGIVIAHNSIWCTQEVWDFTANPNSPRYQRRQLGGTWGAWALIGGGGAAQIVTHTNQLVAAPGAIGIVRVAVAQGQFENIELVYDTTTSKWEATGVYYSDFNGGDQNVVGWDRSGWGRRFPWMQFHNAGLKPQVRATAQAHDISNDQNGGELRVCASADTVYRGSGNQTATGNTQICYDGKYGANYGGWVSLDTGWGDVNSYVTPGNCLVINPQIASNDGNGHNMQFHGVTLMLRWTAI